MRCMHVASSTVTLALGGREGGRVYKGVGGGGGKTTAKAPGKLGIEG